MVTQVSHPTAVKAKLFPLIFFSCAAFRCSKPCVMGHPWSLPLSSEQVSRSPTCLMILPACVIVA